MEIKVSNLNFYYDKKNKQKNIDSIDLKIPNNSIVGITGKSGSGKTTLIKFISGMLIPSSGKVTIGDIVINKKKLYDTKNLKNIVSYVSQDSDEQIFNKTVCNQLIYPFQFLGKLVNHEKLVDILKMVDLDEKILLRNPLSLSSGEQKKILIAQTLLLDTDILIFDDVTNGLDYKSVRSFERLLKNLKNNYNKTIIVVSRDVDFIHRVSDQVVIMNEGKVLTNGNKYDVFKNIDLLKEYNIPIPKTIEFSTIVLNKKNVKIGYRDEINDLLKDIYRYVK